MKVFDRFLRRRDAIGAADHRGLAGEFSRQQVWFITRLGGRGEHAVSVRHDHLKVRILAAVTTGEYANFFTLRRDRLRNVLDQRRLAGTAGGDVSDADHGTIEFGSLKSTAAIQ